MEPANNTLAFVLSVMRRFAQAHLPVWLAGGWAEEFWGLSPPRQHKDVDLLYLALDFHQLDHWFSQAEDMSPIEGKRFSHKRAVLYEQIMIEVVLLEPSAGSYATHYFDRRYTLNWPSDSLSHLLIGGHPIPVASCLALQLHRRCYQQIAQAYQNFLLEQ